MLAPLIARIRSLWNGVLRSRHVDAELQEEFRTHLELRAADLVRAGMSSAEAARWRVEFGITEDQVEKRDGRAGEGGSTRCGSWLDVKIGGRMWEVPRAHDRAALDGVASGWGRNFERYGSSFSVLPLGQR